MSDGFERWWSQREPTGDAWFIESAKRACRAAFEAGRGEVEALRARVAELEARHTDETLRHKAADLQTSKVAVVRKWQEAERELEGARAALRQLADWPETTTEHPSITSQDIAMRKFARAALNPGPSTPDERCNCLQDTNHNCPVHPGGAEPSTPRHADVRYRVEHSMFCPMCSQRFDMMKPHDCGSEPSTKGKP